VTYRTTNRIAKLLQTQPRQNKNDENSGIYSLRCATCHLTYIGPTGHNLKTCYSKHTRYIRSNNPQSAYAQHILQQRHEYGSMQETMTLIHRTKEDAWIQWNNYRSRNTTRNTGSYQNKNRMNTNPYFNCCTTPGHNLATHEDPPPNGSLTNTHSKHTPLMCDTSRDYKRVHTSINGTGDSQQHILAKLYSAT
jgi:hypothetical protein